jgi:microcystin-dependent protein
MASPFVGEIRLLGFTFAPLGWANCNGQLLSIAEYDTLFALIGTTYGGDGQTTFAVPDLRSRVALHQGQGPGMPNYVLGQTGGQPTSSLSATTMPAHTHGVTGTVAQAAAAAGGTTAVPGGNIPAGSTGGENYAPASDADGSLAPMQITGTLQAVGNGSPFENMPPFLAFNYCIALQGIFPTQS